jgi:hypothetical protein
VLASSEIDLYQLEGDVLLLEYESDALSTRREGDAVEFENHCEVGYELKSDIIVREVVEFCARCEILSELYARIQCLRALLDKRMSDTLLDL